MNKALISYIKKNVVVEALYYRYAGVLSYIGNDYIILSNSPLGFKGGKYILDEKVINISHIVAVYKDINVISDNNK